MAYSRHFTLFTRVPEHVLLPAVLNWVNMHPSAECSASAHLNARMMSRHVAGNAGWSNLSSFPRAVIFWSSGHTVTEMRRTGVRLWSMAISPSPRMSSAFWPNRPHRCTPLYSCPGVGVQKSNCKTGRHETHGGIRENRTWDVARGDSPFGGLKRVERERERQSSCVFETGGSVVCEATAACLFPP